MKRIMRPTVPIRASEINITDENFLTEIWRQSWDEFGLLLVGSILIVVSLSPAFLFTLFEWNWLATLWCMVLLPPALAGYGYMIGRNSVGYKSTLSDLYCGTRAYAVRALLACLPVSVLAIMVVTLLPVLAQSPPPIVLIGLVVNCAVLFLGLLMAVYVLPLLALFDLPLHDAWRYGLLLLTRWPYVAFGLAALLFLLFLLVRWLGLGPALVTPLLFMVVAVNATLMLTKQVVIAQHSSHVSPMASSRLDRRIS